ncbi:GTP cyclohydrolase-2 [Oceanibacterium hippocampi]|uniref:GTP cyclohydrolase-2 n=2 Tax=Oceanibacterium hippocampi TaxID=745714 RepID=A0A1Y5RLA8_9PROT|nr:GTP cyclohydrolase-2 [Oceanibacterium hippocampi]
MPVIVRGPDGDWLARAAELLDDRGIERFAEWVGETPKLALTEHRAAILHVRPTGDRAILLPLRRWMDAGMLRQLADPAFDLASPGRGPLDRVMAPAPAAVHGAIKLCKLGRLLPAALVAPIPGDPATLAAKEDLLTVDVRDIEGYEDTTAALLEPVARAHVPLADIENCRIQAFRPTDGGIEHLALLIGDPKPHEPVLVRLHSECFTGDLLGSLKCDCGEQLRGAIRIIQADPKGGILLYLAQEGRGIGLVNKLRAYRLQEQGFDTVDANERLGFDADERLFRPAAEMLKRLGFTAIRLLTNNPEKIEGLARHGITVTDRVAHAFPANSHNEDYLATKRKRSGHYL